MEKGRVHPMRQPGTNGLEGKLGEKGGEEELGNPLKAVKARKEGKKKVKKTPNSCGTNRTQTTRVELSGRRRKH